MTDWYCLTRRKVQRKGKIRVDVIAHNHSTKCQNVNICSWQFRPWWRHGVISPVDWEVMIKWPKGLQCYTGQHASQIFKRWNQCFFLPLDCFIVTVFTYVDHNYRYSAYKVNLEISRGIPQCFWKYAYSMPALMQRVHLDEQIDTIFLSVRSIWSQQSVSLA